jgi:hypothetical protein
MLIKVRINRAGAWHNLWARREPPCSETKTQAGMPFYEIIAALHTDEVEGLAPTSGSTAAPIESQ